MKRINYKKNMTTSIILLLILVIGIGYAYLTSNLSITGATEVVANTWNIHFENIQIKEGSISATSEPTLSNNNMSITYTIHLNRPKDYYEFTVDVKNDGTLPGKVSISELNGITSDAAPVIDYSIKYISGKNINIGDILNAGAKKTIRVKVFYKDDINSGDFPSSDLNLTLTYTLQYVQSEEEEINAGNILQNLASTNSCIYKYEGNVTDRAGETVSASNVYFDRCADKRNIIFAGYCWQAIRTTETGGLKVIYNGIPENGNCNSSRSNINSVMVENGVSSTMLNSEYLYGNSFTYDTSNNTFTLTNTISGFWSDSTYEQLLGKYTCKNLTGTCTQMYYVDSYYSNNSAEINTYTIGSVNYAAIASTSFNGYDKSLSAVGYMYNKVYNLNKRSPETTEYKYGNSFTYSNGMYTLSGTTKNISNWSNGYNTINNTHYTCWNTSGSCNTISYIYYTTSSVADYINLNNGLSINDAIAEMLWNDDVNIKNSNAKEMIDLWYKKNMTNYTSLLEDAVYCNTRNIVNYGGWNPVDGNTTSRLDFKEYSSIPVDLSCLNETDQFSVSNNKAKLTYPVALMRSEERVTINSSSLMSTGSGWWVMSPRMFYDYARFSSTNGSGAAITAYGAMSMGIRPYITLSDSVIIVSGSGTEADPWIFE